MQEGIRTVPRIRPDNRFAEDFEETPYWWRAAPRLTVSETDLPSEIDVAIVGSGFGGGCAALTLAKGGQSVLLLDASELGSGACSRNMGGLVDRVEGITRRGADLVFGQPVKRFELEAAKAGQYIVETARSEGIDFDHRRDGMTLLASTPKIFAAAARKVDLSRTKDPTFRKFVIERERLSEEGGGYVQDRYFGAIVDPDAQTAHPGKLINGILKAASQAGALLRPNTRVESIGPLMNGFHEVITSKGTLRARSVIVATAAYSDNSTPIMRKRIFPFGAHVIATAAIPEDLFRKITPKRRVFVDTRQHWMVLSPAPDAPRLLLSGGYLSQPDPKSWGTKLHAKLTGLFPELQDVPISNAWFGYMPVNSQMLPQIGQEGGVHYSSDTSWAVAGYLGNLIARRLLGANDTQSVFDHVPVNAFPQWMQPPERIRAVARAGMSLLDALNIPTAR